MDATAGPAFLKGHGTENDFILLPDPDGELKLTETRVRTLCDRHRGLGADGVLRVVRTSALGEPVPGVSPETWFMDYRNADGSVAEMCGNGVRLFARYLVEAGWELPGEFVIGTRSGSRPVTTHSDGRVTVDMGPAMVVGESETELAGETYRGIAVDLGNPHLACVIDGDPAALDLTTAPPHDTATFPGGVNVEFVRRCGPERVRMRVYERGVGETRSCGTGTVAATVAALRADGLTSGQRVVEVPGGTVVVAVTPTTSTLTGPAVLVGRGHLAAEWWREAE